MSHFSIGIQPGEIQNNSTYSYEVKQQRSKGSLFKEIVTSYLRMVSPIAPAQVKALSR